MENIKILTAANEFYVNTLIEFINSFPYDYSSLVVYDLGLGCESLKRLIEIQCKKSFSIKRFEYETYPEHVNLFFRNGIDCSYAFKPIIVNIESNLMQNKNKMIMWMDCANRFTVDDLNKIVCILKRQCIYSPISSQSSTIESIELNNRKVVESFGINREEHINSLYSLSGNVVCFDNSSDEAKLIIDNWYRHALNPDIICPVGTNRNNNRQDQTVLSILVYLFEKNNGISLLKDDIGIKYWNKKDAPTISPELKPYRLYEKSSKKQIATIHCKHLNDAIEIYSERKNMDSVTLLNYYDVL